MSQSEQRGTRQCVSCGIKVMGTNAASFSCPECGNEINRCEKCRKQSNLYKCSECGFTGP
ncbi:zinc finger domain-containing protein [Salinarchaeum sp. IM2453]|uniref:HVO_2753 family zinc finger protein n=1 Tax=Salinarchaeum sp. IM2453 TaxID=2862870 RepID=UPI001C831383|nr:HVO_2753 family zinc finger protein [Salinarchaeum sp. IM2453]QZA88825.1 zinc finger domain-containing protein [Salinarchaeum sp. IM2453]